MHDFGGTKNGINRAGLNAEGAPNAILLVNHSDLEWDVQATLCIKCKDGLVKELGERSDTCLTTRWAAINGRCALSDGTRVGRAAIKTTFCALCLRKQTVDTFSQH
jgi:hypothetical protein